MEEQRKLIDFEKARKSVMEILAGKVTTQVAVKVAMAMQEQSVDAVEVVRCKDCKRWLKDFPGCTYEIGRCEWANYLVGRAGYCVYGERKESDGEQKEAD